MSPFFENDPLFGDLISYARAVARRRGLVTLDRLSFDLGVGCALVTGKVGLGGVAAAFEALGDPDRHAKILIDPRRRGGL